MPTRLRRILSVIIRVAGGVIVGLAVAVLFFVHKVAKDTGLEHALVPLWQASFMLQQHYVEPLDPKKTAERLLAGLINDLDPHSAYLSPEDIQSFDEQMRGSYGGIGIEPKAGRSGNLQIGHVMPKGPAAEAGLRPGDRILAIDGKAVGSQVSNGAPDLMADFKRIRGPIGSVVELAVASPDASEPSRIVKVKRASIELPIVRWGLIDAPHGKVLWLRASQFNNELIPEAVAAIIEAQEESKGKISGIMLDLRSNPGGLVNAAVGLAGLFGERNAVVVSTRERNATEPHVWQVQRGELGYDTEQGGPDLIAKARSAAPWLKSAPMVVLVNRHSASASEIVAGALKDWGRASIVGNQTFGKGSVQNVIPLANNAGALKITTSRYYTPSGKAIQAVGVPVDVEVRTPLDQGLREADIPNHLGEKDGPRPQAEPLAPPPTAAEEKTSDVEDGRASFSARISTSGRDPYIKAGLKELAAKMAAKARPAPIPAAQAEAVSAS